MCYHIQFHYLVNITTRLDLIMVVISPSCVRWGYEPTNITFGGPTFYEETTYLQNGRRIQKHSRPPADQITNGSWTIPFESRLFSASMIDVFFVLCSSTNPVILQEISNDV